jgi:uncharacterized membrane protein
LSTSLISSEWHFAVWASMLGIASFGLWAETNRLGRSLSGVVIALGGAMILSNIGIIPKTAPTYDVVWTYMVPMAIPMLLFKANLRRIIPETKGMLIAFLLGASGTICGVLLGFYLLPLGEGGAAISGTLAASYIGGSMNYAAVGDALEVESSLFLAGIAVDNVIGVIYMASLALMPSLALLRRWLPSPIIEAAEQDVALEIEHKPETVNLNLLHISLSLLLSLTICAVSTLLAEWWDITRFSILLITTFTVVIANLFPKAMDALEGDFEVGILMMYLFFVTVGASADIGAMFDSALMIAYLTIIIVVVHMLVIFIGSRFFKLDLAEVIIASNACAAGPTTAAALAASKGWKTLVTPAIMCGVLGYVIANFVGVFLGGFLG